MDSSQALIEAAASDPNADPDFLRFILEAKLNEKNNNVLLNLARNINCPQDVLDKLLDKAQAPVKVAVLTRAGTSSELLTHWASDRRIGVAEAVASAPNMPVKVYRTVLDNHNNPKVALAALRNVDLPVVLKAMAMSKLIESRNMSALSNRKRYEVDLLVKQNLESFPHIGVELLDMLRDDAVVSGPRLEAMVSLPGLTTEQVSKLCTMAVRSFRRFGLTYSDYHDNPWTALAELVAYDDVPSLVSEEIQAMCVEADSHSNRPSNRFSTTYERRWVNIIGKNVPVTRSPVVAAFDGEEIPRLERVKSALAALYDPLERLHIARTLGDMTDEEFVAIVFCQASDYTWWPEGLDLASLPARGRADLDSFVEAAKGSPVRVAALLCVLPVNLIPKDVSSSVSVEDIFYAYRSKDGYEYEADNGIYAYAHNGYMTTRLKIKSATAWVQLFKDRGFTEDDLSWLPAEIFSHGSMRGFRPWPSQMAPDARMWITQAAASSMWSKFGPSQTHWDIFNQMVSVEGVTVSEAMSSTGDVAA